VFVVRLDDARVVEANEPLARMLGRDTGDLVGSSALEVGLVGDRADLETLAGGGPPLQAVLERASGDRLPVRLAGAAVEVDGHRYLTAVARPGGIAESHVAEALRASEQRYRGIIEAAGDGVWMLDEEDRTSFVNRAMAEMLGYEVRDMLGRLAGDFAAEPEESRRALVRRHRGRAERYELKLRRRDGREIWVEMSASPLIDEEGRYRGAVAMVADQTERREARLARERLEHRLQQAQRLETVGQLAGGIAHDFNNLLAVILNYAYFVRERLPDDSPVRGDVDEIRHAAKRASELTHQLLVFSRREEVRPEVLDVNGVVRDAERLLGRTLGEQIDLVTNLAPDACMVEADAAQLEQVVVNLVVNSRDAMPDGGQIRIETQRVTLDPPVPEALARPAPGPYVLLSVTDDGHGMEPAVAARAFEPFFTTKPAGAGTGLGLATVYGTVTAGGGDAEVESVPGEGTTVRVYLPAADA
jgi:PAS domain S-box-containing protein